MATVIAKFKVFSVTEFEGTAKAVILNPVAGGSEENKAFWKYTPSGKLEMTIDNPDATKHFKPGAECFIEFTFPDA